MVQLPQAPTPAMLSPQQAYLQRFGGLADRVVGNAPSPLQAGARVAAGIPAVNVQAARVALQNINSPPVAPVPPLPVLAQTITNRPGPSALQAGLAGLFEGIATRPIPALRPASVGVAGFREGGGAIPALRPVAQGPGVPLNNSVSRRSLDDFLSGFR